MLTPKQQEALDALAASGGNQQAAARALGIDPKSLRERLQSAGKKQGIERLANHGYNLRSADRTEAEAWADHAAAFERKIGKAIGRHDQRICRAGPFVIFHGTDEHVDDDASALHVLAADIQRAHDLGAIMCHGGDLLNNWPVAGKLAKQWAEQSCTLPDALKRAKHFISIFRPDVWVDGNHEEMNPYLANLLDSWLPASTLRDYWRCDFTVEVPGGRDCRVALSHKFQKGSSWFHALHGHLREMLESEARDLYMDGHYHQAGVMRHHMAERGHTSLLVASAGYKVADNYARRISRGGGAPKLEGRCHWIVVDPFADGPMCHAFDDADHAEVMLNGLQNLRAA
jgi:hypothetical protein